MIRCTEIGEPLYADDLPVHVHSADEYVDALMALVPASASEELCSLFKSDARSMWNIGWSFDDARWMFLAHAAISPELSKEDSFACMDALETKYRPCPRCGRLGFETRAEFNVSGCSYCCGSPGCEVCS